MVRHIITGITLAALAVLAGCGSAHTADPVTAAPVVTSSPSTPTTSVAPDTTTAAPTTTAPTTKPLAFYAHQYETIVAPANKALDALKALPDSAPDADQTKYATALATASSATANALLRATWPDAQTTQDIRSLARATEALATDLQGLGQIGSDTIARDAGIQNADVAVVRADLGLPPAPQP